MFACLFSAHDKIRLSHHEQVCLMKLRFERYIFHHRATQIIIPLLLQENMRSWRETMEIVDLTKKKLENATD